MPKWNATYDPANGFQTFIQAAPFDGTVQATNNGAYSVYVKNMTTNVDAAKITPGATRTFPIVQDQEYRVQVMGDVSIDYTITRT